jgi:uncharacterized protein
VGVEGSRQDPVRFPPMIFVDSGAWIALLDKRDGYHDRAIEFHRALQKGVHGRLVTTDYVLDESVTYLRLAGGIDLVKASRRVIQASESLQIVWTTPELFWESWEMLADRPDKRWSFTDCHSFRTMVSLGIDSAFGFDTDFHQAGFQLLPGSDGPR